MTKCIVAGCSSSTTKGDKVHNVPSVRKKADRKTWLSNVNRLDLMCKPQKIVVCNKHFHRKCYQKNLRVEYMEGKIQYDLVPGSVTTIVQRGKNDIKEGEVFMKVMDVIKAAVANNCRKVQEGITKVEEVSAFWETQQEQQASYLQFLNNDIKEGEVFMKVMDAVKAAVANNCRKVQEGITEVNTTSDFWREQEIIQSRYMDFLKIQELPKQIHEILHCERDKNKTLKKRVRK
ncbi:uncharacterized protein LOC128210991 [Mya arenaria]|uniref:uncharacterized protein LOC128210991 n=1 Tax=Mya arenaria TaxID=6604 RepID=UPI0022E42F42|nr:uncharacterized protein LOC128210991 [Mya arenaria]